MTSHHRLLIMINHPPHHHFHHQHCHNHQHQHQQSKYPNPAHPTPDTHTYGTGPCRYPCHSSIVHKIASVRYISPSSPPHPIPRRNARYTVTTGTGAGGRQILEIGDVISEGFFPFFFLERAVWLCFGGTGVRRFCWTT
ncbi:hypothetical protein EX30DRAFT_272026 [Ascodesmis nigricans]|uniref:Uncharacterized protein n=1 Tax=Ascodesmis nigricans TaxID=341454 RepID=A0A4S2MX64_9PEZI|nr:hypothetical protein EX30DRAFT_272026 [Ascodesmis nigricans]